MRVLSWKLQGSCAVQEAVEHARAAIAFTRRGGGARPVAESLAALIDASPAVCGALLQRRGEAADAAAAGAISATAHAEHGADTSNDALVDTTARSSTQHSSTRDPATTSAADRTSEEVGAGVLVTDEQLRTTPLATAALVFGREESGLTADELEACTHACAIPTGRLQPSMNLSHAVATVLSQVYERSTGHAVAGGAEHSTAVGAFHFVLWTPCMPHSPPSDNGDRQPCCTSASSDPQTAPSCSLHL